MSFFYKSNNEDKAKNSYRKNLIYGDEILEDDYENLIDFYITELYLYGRVNYKYIPIVHNSNAIPLQNITTTNTEQNDLQALPFVVNAFNDLNQQFNKKLLTGEIDINDPFLSKLEVKKAYQNPKALYTQYLSEIRAAIVEQIEEKNIKFSNIEMFKHEFVHMLEALSKQMPITYSAFIKSHKCPMNVSGLVIEIADIDYSNDQQKIINFKNSKNWKFYLNACRSYGFWVDSSNPFRMIANIGSTEMLEYASRNGLTSTYSVLNDAYEPACINFESTFKQFMFDCYELSKATYLEVEHCLDGTTRTEIVEPAEYSSSELKYLLDDIEFLMLYAKIRLNEENLKLLTHNKDKLVKNTMSILKRLNLTQAILYFESYINNTFHYTGSLTDRINRDKLIREQQEEFLQEDSIMSTIISGY